MKKIFVVLTSLSLIFLLGCSFEKEQLSEKENIEKINYEGNSNTYEYEELNKIAEIINLDKYNMNVESDNEGTRVILFEKDKRNMYKSIFVKEKKHLKLIDLESNEKPLINGPI